MRYNSETREVTMTVEQATALFSLMGCARHAQDTEEGVTAIKLALAAMTGLDHFTDLTGDESPAELLGGLERELMETLRGTCPIAVLMVDTLDRGIAKGRRTDLAGGVVD